MASYQLGDLHPRIDPGAWVAENAVVIGDVRIAARASVWWNTVIRGDRDTIIIGEATNVQDSSVLHTDPGIVLELSPRVTVGHRVVLHGCSIGESTLIGMGSVVMNRARIGRQCLVGANTLIPEDKSFPDRVLIMGSPGKVVRELTEQEIKRLEGSAAHYAEHAQRYARELRRLE